MACHLRGARADGVRSVASRIAVVVPAGPGAEGGPVAGHAARDAFEHPALGPAGAEAFDVGFIKGTVRDDQGVSVADGRAAVGAGEVQAVLCVNVVVHRDQVPTIASRCIHLGQEVEKITHRTPPSGWTPSPGLRNLYCCSSQSSPSFFCLEGGLPPLERAAGAQPTGAVKERIWARNKGAKRPRAQNLGGAVGVADCARGDRTYAAEGFKAKKTNCRAKLDSIGTSHRAAEHRESG